MNAFMFRAASTAAVLALALLASSNSFASNDPEVAAHDVFYGDLNLQNAAGVSRLHARIANAATAVCGGEDRTTVAHALRREQCRTAAIERAVAEVNSPLLTQYHEKRVLLAAR